MISDSCLVVAPAILDKELVDIQQETENAR